MSREMVGETGLCVGLIEMICMGACAEAGKKEFGHADGIFLAGSLGKSWFMRDSLSLEDGRDPSPCVRVLSRGRQLFC